MLFFLCGLAAGLDNGLGLRPVMGYNTWYDHGCNLDQAELEVTVKAMQTSGLVALGYQMFDLDDCWAGGRHKNGTVYSQFPSGTLRPLADVVHAAGMKFGAYTCRGKSTCASRPGSLGYETADAATYASWGVDLLKEDSCFTVGDNESLAIEQYSRMRDALNATGRPILFALCGWFPWYASKTFSEIGNMRRIGLDSSNWPAVLSNVDTNANLAAHAKPGAFNDPCLLISTDASGKALATELQTRAQFSLWAMMASPLLISGDVRKMSAFNLQTYSNTEVIRIDQDVLGKQGTRLVGGPFTGQAYLSTCDAGNPAQRFERGSAVNSTEGYIISAADGASPALCFMARGCQSDPIFGPCVIGGNPTCSGNATVPHPDQRYSLDVDTAQLKSELDPAGSAPTCMDLSIFPYLLLKPCAAVSAVPAAQRWTFAGTKAGTRVITIKHQGSGTCLTRGGLSTTNVWGRELEGGDYALLFVNTGPAAADVMCDTACWAAAGLASGKKLIKFAARDLWKKVSAGTLDPTEPFTVRGLEPGGGVAMFRLRPV